MNTKPKRINRSYRGVRVIVYRWPTGETHVDALCGCFGYRFRVHTNPSCPRLVKARRR